MSRCKLTISGQRVRAGADRSISKRHGVKLNRATLSESEARAAVRAGHAQVVLIVPKEYGPRFTAATPAPVLLVADSADSQTRKIADRARAMLGGYASAIAQLRLQVRGVNPLLAVAGGGQ